jgi:glycosyltransferase involved in cell wall biosynthesis
MNRVSVIVPCFNQARYLGEAVDSLIGQTRSPDQIIIVNDGSTDNTAEVAGQFKQACYLFQANRGLAAARNAGLQEAIGEYVLFLDSDDVLLPNAIEHCLAAFATQPDAAFVYGGHRYVDAMRQPICEVAPQHPLDHFTALLRRNHIAMHGTVMYRTDIIRKAGGFDESLPCCEDYDLYLRLAENYPVGVYDSISAEYRQHGDNMTRNAPMMLKAALAVLARYASAARTSSERRAAYAEGEQFWSRFYGDEIVKLMAIEWSRQRRGAQLAALLGAGLKHDHRFALRLARRLTSAAGTRLRRLIS